MLKNRDTCDALSNLIPFEQLKKLENTNGRVLLLVNMQAEACNFTISNTPPRVLFTSLKLYNLNFSSAYFLEQVFVNSFKTVLPSCKIKLI